jgi:predicted metal-dependent HD superfamily phosphohydrolase
MAQDMRTRWSDLLRHWAVDSVLADRKFDEVRSAYAGPGRFYHTLDHIHEVLHTVERLGGHAQHLDAVCLAGWLHDVVYDSRASDNEERSADVAEHLCRELSIPEGPQVASLILKTKSHSAENDPDAWVLLDADLAILGAPEPIYRTYARNIRLEYAWVPEVQYRQGRRRILENFLARPRIYHLLSELEEAARRNLSAEILHLSGPIKADSSPAP